MPASPRSPRVTISRLISTSISVKPDTELGLSIGAVPIAVVVRRDIDPPAEVHVDATHRHTAWRGRGSEVDVQHNAPRSQAAVAPVCQGLSARRAGRALHREAAERTVRREHRSARHDLPAVHPLPAEGERTDGHVGIALDRLAAREGERAVNIRGRAFNARTDNQVIERRYGDHDQDGEDDEGRHQLDDGEASAADGDAHDSYQRLAGVLAPRLLTLRLPSFT